MHPCIRNRKIRNLSLQIVCEQDSLCQGSSPAAFLGIWQRKPLHVSHYTPAVSGSFTELNVLLGLCLSLFGFLVGSQAVRVTKPNIPESIRRNYELM